MIAADGFHGLNNPGIPYSIFLTGLALADALKASGLRATQSDVDDFRRRVDPEGKPVANSIGHDQLSASPLVKSRPVAEESGTHTVLAVKH
jgi:hypothetical protein